MTYWNVDCKEIGRKKLRRFYCFFFFILESQKTAIIPLLKKSTEQAIFLQDDTLSVVAKNFGQWVFNLKVRIIDYTNSRIQISVLYNFFSFLATTNL